MPVMLLDHTGIGMTELRRYDRERNAAHCEPAGVSVPQPMEIHGRINFRPRTSRAERALLLGFAPRLPIRPEEQPRAAGLP